MVDAPGLKQEKEVEGAGVGARVVEIPREATASAAPFFAKRLRLSGDLKMFLAEILEGTSVVLAQHHLPACPPCSPTGR